MYICMHVCMYVRKFVSLLMTFVILFYSESESQRRSSRKRKSIEIDPDAPTVEQPSDFPVQPSRSSQEYVCTAVCMYVCMNVWAIVDCMWAPMAGCDEDIPTRSAKG
jgi:hypothetical protein